MPDRDRIEQVRAMAKLLAFFLPPPARAPIADKLYGLGFRLHPELSALELTAPEGPANMGNWRAQFVQQRSLENVLKEMNPELYERFVTAETEEQKAAIREEIRFKYGSQIADLQRRVDQLPPDPEPPTPVPEPQLVTPPPDLASALKWQAPPAKKAAKKAPKK